MAAQVAPRGVTEFTYFRLWGHLCLKTLPGGVKMTPKVSKMTLTMLPKAQNEGSKGQIWMAKSHSMHRLWPLILGTGM